MAIYQPPIPRAKRRNAVLRLYDAPLYRDWAFWLTACNVALGAFSQATSDLPSSLPLWLDMLLGVLVIGGLFGVFPAWLRLLFRRWRWRRAQRLKPSGFPSAAEGWQSPAYPSVATQPAPMPFVAPRPQDRPVMPPRNASGLDAYAMPVSPPVPPITPLPASNTRPAPPRPADQADPLAIARQSLPHPIARAVLATQQAHTARDQYEAVIDAGETLAITLSVTAAALLNDHAQNDSGSETARLAGPELARLKRGYLGSGGATFGTWTSWLASLRLLVNNHPTLIPGLREALESRPDHPSVVDHLNALRNERNRAAHGNKPHNQQEAGIRLADLTPHLEGALRRAQFLQDVPWLLTVSSSYQPRTGKFAVVTRRVMGDHPDFEKETFEWERPVADDMFYVLGPSGPLTLSPFVASRFCGHCRQIEVCYAYRAGKSQGAATFKSFDSGHDIPVDELGDDLRALPDRS